MKMAMKKVLSVLMATVIIVLCMTACGKAGDSEDVHIEGELSDIIAEIYAGANVDSETKEAMEGFVTDILTEENEMSLLGTSDVPYTEGIFSVPMISAIAYQCVLLRVNPDDADSVKALLLENADLRKWVCVEAETAQAESMGDLVLFIMGEQKTADAVVASFKALK